MGRYHIDRYIALAITVGCVLEPSPSLGKYMTGIYTKWHPTSSGQAPLSSHLYLGAARGGEKKRNKAVSTEICLYLDISFVSYM